ncbi:MAG TPA: hypothetical protein VGM62_05560 [Chthoniobacterales bacterium]
MATGQDGKWDEAQLRRQVRSQVQLANAEFHREDADATTLN